MTAPVKQLSDGNPGGSGLGQSATDLISFYGVTPVAQRAGAVQATSALSISSNTTIAASLVNWILEVSNTLIALGIWKGAA